MKKKKFLAMLLAGSMAVSSILPTVSFSVLADTEESASAADLLEKEDHISYISGYTDGTVRPNRDVTRGEAAMILYSLLKNKDVSSEKTFSDVDTDSYLGKAVSAMAALKVTAGYTDGRYGKNDPIKREQFCQMISIFLSEKDTSVTNAFTDVSKDSYAYDAIQECYNAGLISGTGTSTFSPKDNLKRAQLIAIINHLLGRKADSDYLENHSGATYFKDLTDRSKWYYGDIIEASRAHEYTKDDDSGNETWKTPDEVNLQILGTSDQHGKFLPFDYNTYSESTSGSTAQLYTEIKALRAENPTTMLVDAGDVIQDNAVEQFNDDPLNPMIEAFNIMKYDVTVPGNHEFNYGVPTLQKIESKNNAQILCSNVYEKDGKTRILGTNWRIYDVNGVNVAFIGAVTPNITKWDSANLEGYVVTNPIDEIQTALDEINGRADAVILVDHSDIDNEYDVKGSGVRDIANEFGDKLDLIVAGHGHQVINETVNGVPIVENKNQGQTLAVCNLKIDKNSSGKYDVSDVTTEVRATDPDTEAAPEIVSALSEYDKRAKANALVVVGKLTGGALVPDAEIPGIPQGHVADSAFVDLICKVQMYYSGADVTATAMFNKNANLQPGDIRRCDVAQIYKFANTLYKAQMTGKQLKKYMEWSVNYFAQAQPDDLTVTFNPDVRDYLYDMFEGVDYEVNVSKPAGSRIENLKWSNTGEPVKDDDVFTIAVNNYRFNSQLKDYGPVFEEGDGLPVLLETDCHQGMGLREMITDYIQNVKGGTITNECDNNWKLTGLTTTDEEKTEIADLIKEGKLSVSDGTDGRTSDVTKAITRSELNAALGK